jgi:hypothetical protein
MFIFDGINKVIQGGYSSSSTVELDIKTHLYSAWKEWVLINDNAKYLQAFSTTGGDPISLTISVGSYFFLENGWKIRPLESNHRLILNGNLYTRDDSSPFLNVNGYSVITETRNSSITQSITTGNVDISSLATKTQLQVVNEGVKKASLLIPHVTDLP